jgi:hypothetical protein
MTSQEILILSFFNKDIPKEMKDSDLTTEMIEAGIGSNESTIYAYYELVHQLKNKDLLVLYKDPSKAQQGITRAVGPELLVLSDKAVQILQRQEAKRIHEAFVTELQFNKLKSEYDLLASQLADYNKTKKRTFLALLISIISALAAIASLLIKK